MAVAPAVADVFVIEGARPLNGRILLPHLNTEPYQLVELMGSGAPPALTDPSYTISLKRLERAFARDAAEWYTPRSHRMSSRAASNTMTNPTLVSAALWSGPGRYALYSTTGSPKTKRDVACPRPHANPRRAAPRAARSFPDAISVVTAAR